jgi:hypothetical protein
MLTKLEHKKSHRDEYFVVLTQKEYDNLLDELDELEDIRLYDEAKQNDDGTRILFSDYLRKRRKKDA